MPYERPLATLGTEVVLDSGDYAGLLDKALAAIDWHELQERPGAPPRRRRMRRRGACVLRREERARSVRRRADQCRRRRCWSRWSPARASLGQGFETVVAQICADALGVDYRRVRVIHGRTDRIAFGHGAFAVARDRDDRRGDPPRGVEVREKAIELAAELLQSAGDALDIVDGKVVRKSASGGPSMTLGRDRQGAWSRPRSCAARARLALPPTAGSTPIT